MFPGQHPGNELYNLDFRDEDFWATEAVLKETRDELKLLNIVRLAMHGQNEYRDRHQLLCDIIGELEGKNISGQRYTDTWKTIMAKGNKGKK